MQGSGLRVEGSGFRVEGSGLRTAEDSVERARPERQETAASERDLY